MIFIKTSHGGSLSVRLLKARGMGRMKVYVMRRVGCGGERRRNHVDGPLHGPFSGLPPTQQTIARQLPTHRCSSFPFILCRQKLLETVVMVRQRGQWLGGQ